MQPMSHDSDRRAQSPEWVEQIRARPDVHEAQENQWAVLRHELESENALWQDASSQQYDTDDDTLSSSNNAFLQTFHHVDIVVVGVGGGGMNAINRMISANVRGVRFIAMNTDAQVLALSQAPTHICLGQHHTKGLGAGGQAAVGTRTATESAAEIRAVLGDADLVFIAAGMGGGTGTGAAPVVASIAKKLGALTLGIVTLPFSFEGSRRRRIAEQGIAELNSEVDALITIPNDRLLATTGRNLNLLNAFKIVDDVLRQGVQGIAEVINVPGMVNVDFADVRSVLREAGTALMSIGHGQGPNRAQHAAEMAIAGGFLSVTIHGAKRVLFNISGGEDMTLFEVHEVAEHIREAIDDTADITFGAVIDPALNDAIRVTLIAAGMKEMHTMQLPVVRLDQVQAAQMPRSASRGEAYPPSQPRVSPASGASAPAPRASSERLTGSEEVDPAGQPSQPSSPPHRQAQPPRRQQRSLNDLRGIRSLGQRQENLRRKQLADEKE